MSPASVFPRILVVSVSPQLHGFPQFFPQNSQTNISVFFRVFRVSMTAIPCLSCVDKPSSASQTNKLVNYKPTLVLWNKDLYFARSLSPLDLWYLSSLIAIHPTSFEWSELGHVLTHYFDVSSNVSVDDDVTAIQQRLRIKREHLW